MVVDNTSPLCPACGSSHTSPVLEARDYTVSGEMFTIRHCGECTIRFTYPVPDEHHIGKYYHSEDYISHSDTQKGIINKLYHIVRKISLQQKKQYVVNATGIQQGHILDIGCGTGSFLHTMKQSGWLTTGLEPDENARQVAQKKYQLHPLSIEQLFQLPEQSFDAITMWHVLEHVHRLHEYFEQIKLLLQPDGKLLIAVPNYTSRDASHYKAFWAAYDVPRHLYHFSPASLVQLAEKHGFHVSKKIVMPFDAFYISLLSEKYRRGKNNYIAGALTGIRSWMNAKGNNDQASSLVYILQK